LSLPKSKRRLEWSQAKGPTSEDFIPYFDDSRVIEERENGNVIVREAYVAADLHESISYGRKVGQGGMQAT
jgi:hypothetical protein